jgi:hypothetical protein
MSTTRIAFFSCRDQSRLISFSYRREATSLAKLSVLFLSIFISSCGISDISKETIELQQKAADATLKLEGYAKEQQLIINETTNLNRSASSLAKLTSQLAQAEKTLANERRMLEEEQKKLEAAQLYLTKHLPTQSQPLTPKR